MSKVFEVEEGSELLRILEELVQSLYGEQGVKLLKLIVEKGYVAEELLAQDTGIKSNEGRKILQKMSEENLVVPGKLRTKDGVLHIWRLNEPGVKSILLLRLRKTREKLTVRLRFEEENTTYQCPRCSRRYTLEEAYASDFLCPNDGELLIEVDRDRIIEALKESIKKVDELIRRLERV